VPNPESAVARSDAKIQMFTAPTKKRFTGTAEEWTRKLFYSQPPGARRFEKHAYYPISIGHWSNTLADE